MRLNLRLKKVLATTAAATIMATAVPVVTYAKDYDNHWAKEAITKWSEKEVLGGYEDGTFKPNNKVTRGELAAIIVRVFGLTDTSAAEKYTDVETTKWYAADVEKVSSAGIMNDYEDGTFKPNQEATREEAAYAIAKAYKVAAKDTHITFKDQAQIADWAEDEIVSLVAGGYLNGNPDGTFRPNASLTRAEAVTMVDKITADLVNVAGVYSQDIEGNLVVNTKDVELKDMTITGNLYLAEGIGEGSVKLNNVTVLGDIIVEGGGVQAVHIIGKSKVNNIIVDKAGKNPVRLLLGSLIEVKGTLTLHTEAIIEGNGVKLNKVIVAGAQDIQFVGNLTIEDMTIQATTELVLVDGVTINHLTISKDAVDTVLIGRGEKSRIKNILVEANGLKVRKGFNYSKDKIVVADNVTIPPVYPSSGGGGGGGGGSTDPEPEPPVTDKPITLTGMTVKLAGEEAKVPMTSNKINVVIDSKEKTVTINGKTFEDSDVIQSITAHEKDNVAELKVSLLGTDFGATLKPGTPYGVDDLAAIVANTDNQELVWNTLATFKEQLTNTQYDKAVELINEAIKGVADYAAKNNDMSVNYILGKANALKAKLQDPDVVAIHSVLEEALRTLGITASGLGTETPSIEATLTVTGVESGYEMDKIAVSVSYK